MKMAKSYKCLCQMILLVSGNFIISTAKKLGKKATSFLKMMIPAKTFIFLKWTDLNNSLRGI